MTAVEELEQSRPVNLVQSEEAFEDLLEVLESEERVGVDTEANSFHAYFERVCLIQVSTGSGDWVVDPLAVDPRPMGRLFADEHREVVLHAGEFDVLSLKRDFDFEFEALFDTQVAAMLLGMGQVGYASLVEQFFGMKLEKGEQRSNWGRRPLSEKQVEYAAADTRYLLPLREQLGELLTERGREREARAGFSRLAAAEPRPRVFDPNGFRRVKGFRELDSVGRAIVRAVYLAREERARLLDRPPFRVLGNDALIALAAERPLDQNALSKVKGIPKATRQKYSKNLLEAVRRGLDDPEPPPAVARRGGRGQSGAGRLDPEAYARFERLRSWRNSKAEEQGIEGQVIARNELLREIARKAPRSRAQLEAVIGSDPHLVRAHGQEILAVLSGRPPSS